MPGRNKHSPSTRQILLVDDEPAVLRGLQLLCNLQRGLKVCGQAETAAAALALIHQFVPDLAVIDLHLKHGSGFNLIEQMRSDFPRVKILVFSMQHQLLAARRAFVAGAHGYVTKEEGAEKLIEAIGWVLKGQFYLSEMMAVRLPNHFDITGPMIARQRPRL